MTPSEIGINGNKDALRSPLAKRKKLAADRTGSSRLKDSILPSDMKAGKGVTAEELKDDLPEEEEGEEEEEDGASDDDFLAGALEEDWG